MAYTPKFKPGDTIVRINNPEIILFITRFGAPTLTGDDGHVYGYDPNDGVYEGYSLPASDPFYWEYWTASSIDERYKLVGGGLSNNILWIAGGVGVVLLLVLFARKS